MNVAKDHYEHKHRKRDFNAYGVDAVPDVPGLQLQVTPWTFRVPWRFVNLRFLAFCRDISS